MRAITITWLALLGGLAVAGCGGGDTVKGPPPQAPKTLQVKSPAFSDGGTIPTAFTCEGDDVSPPIGWRNLPTAAKNLALLMEDPDASEGTFVHWTLYNIPRFGVGINANSVPIGARQGENSFGKEGYGGPCPPKGEDPHRYVFTVYALRAPLNLEPGAAPAAVRSAIAKQAIARGTLTGTFGR